MDGQHKIPQQKNMGTIVGLTHLFPYTNYFHDASVALVQGGRVKAAVAEERFTRIPHHAGYPACALNWIFNILGGGLSKIDAIALPWPECGERSAFAPSTKLRELYRMPKEEKVVFIDHQRAHAFAAYAYSPFESGTILALDGMGLDGDTVTAGAVYRYDPVTAPSLVGLIPREGSTLGEFYGAITIALGWEMLKDEGKTMSLAAYGDPTLAKERLQELAPRAVGLKLIGKNLDLNEHGPHNGRHLVTFNGIMRHIVDTVIHDFGREATAAAAQQLLEDEVISLARAATNTPGSNLCLTGGLFLNIHLARRLRENGYSVFTYPNPGDGGTAVGAALAHHYDRTSVLPRQLDSPVYIGPSFTNAEVEAAIKAGGAPYRSLEAPAETVAGLLEQGVVLGLFQGAMEWGPRALGNRSVIADPQRRDIRDRINKILKKRDSFQPFGPMMTETAATVLLENPTESPFMTDAFRVTSEGAVKLKAVIHEDGTVRPQIIREKDNLFCLNLLRAFGRKTGVEALLNTSLNLHGEAICQTPQDAIYLWQRRGVDALLMPPFLIATSEILQKVE